MQSPSKNSTTREKEDTPPSSPPKPTTTSPAETVPATPSQHASPAVGREANEGGGGLIGESVRIPWQVVELTSGGGSGGEGRSSVALAAAVPVVGGLVEKVIEKPGVAGEEGGSSSNKGKLKRKGSELKDPPSGKPICPECGREFASWKSVFGHLRVHSRRYTGLFPPPVSPPRQPPQGEEASEVRAGGEEEGSSANKAFGFDLNEPLESSDAEPSSNVEKNDDEEKDGDPKLGFDLNQPPAEEDSDDIEGGKQA